MKVVVVGCGGMGRIHAIHYASMPEVELVGVCDIEVHLAERLADETNCRAFASYEEMMSAVKPDLVSIALPTYLHKEYTVKTAALGAHVVCEKPMALTLEDAAEMIRACEQAGVRLFVGHVVRFFPEYADIKRKVEAGGLGKLGVAHAKRSGSHPAKVKEWFGNFEQSGGVILDLMVHDIDFMRWALGEVKSVYALNRRDQEMDYALATLVFEQGAVANLEAFWGYPGPFHTKAEIAGSDGIVRNSSLEAQSLQLVRVSEGQDGPAAVEVPGSPGYHDPYYYELRHFVRCIRENRESIVTPNDAYKAVEIALAAIASAKTGSAVHL